MVVFVKSLKIGISYTDQSPNQPLGGLVAPLHLLWMVDSTYYLLRYLDYFESVVILCKKAMFFPKLVSFNKDDILNILQIYRIHSRINIWTGKVIINWNHYKSMQDTIDTMFVNEKIIRIYSFCPFSTWNTRHMHFKRSKLWQKHSPPPFPWPPKIPHSNLRLR